MVSMFLQQLLLAMNSTFQLKSEIFRVSLYEAKTILVFFISILQYDFHKLYSQFETIFESYILPFLIFNL